MAQIDKQTDSEIAISRFRTTRNVNVPSCGAYTVTCAFDSRGWVWRAQYTTIWAYALKDNGLPQVI